MGYWGTTQSSRVKRIIFDNTLRGYPKSLYSANLW